MALQVLDGAGVSRTLETRQNGSSEHIPKHDIGTVDGTVTVDCNGSAVTVDNASLTVDCNGSAVTVDNASLTVAGTVAVSGVASTVNVAVQNASLDVDASGSTGLGVSSLPAITIAGAQTLATVTAVGSITNPVTVDEVNLPTTGTTGQHTVSASSTVLGASFGCERGVELKAPSTNAGNLWYGFGSASTTTGHLVEPGERVFVEIENVNDLYIIGTASDVVTYSAT